MISHNEDYSEVHVHTHNYVKEYLLTVVMQVLLIDEM